jgi:hypothetical protein
LKFRRGGRKCAAIVGVGKQPGLSTQSCALIVGGYNKCTSCLGEKPNVAKAIWAAFTIFVATGRLLGPLVALRETIGALDWKMSVRVLGSLGLSCVCLASLPGAFAIRS